MNISTLFTLSFAFLSILSTVARASDPVVDYKGDPVEAGFYYEIWGVGRNKGAIGLGQGVDVKNCLRNVISHPFDPTNTVRPDPIAFFGANNSDPIVRVGQDYNLLFSKSQSQPCNVWQVNLDIGSKHHNFITTGGLSGQLGCWQVNTWFQLQKAKEGDYNYNLIANPRVCLDNSYCPEKLVWVEDGGEYRFYLNQREFLTNSNYDYEEVTINFGTKMPASSILSLYE